MPNATPLPNALQPAPAAPPPPPSADAARLDAELAQDRAAAAQAEQAGGQGQVIVRDGDKTVLRMPDGHIRVVQGDRTIDVPGASFPFGRITTNTGDPFPPSPREQVPEGLVPLIGTFFGLTAATIVLFPIARAFARRMDRKTMAPAAPSTEVASRLDRIEQAIESIAEEVERVTEAQRYSARLLTERLPEALPRANAPAEQSR